MKFHCILCFLFLLHKRLLSFIKIEILIEVNFICRHCPLAVDLETVIPLFKNFKRILYCYLIHLTRSEKHVHRHTITCTVELQLSELQLSESTLGKKYGKCEIEITLQLFLFVDLC